MDPQPHDCYLYLLAHATLPAIKIGVSNDVILRASVIGHEIAWDRSLVAVGERDACFAAEKVLHQLLRRHRLEGMAGSGRTEWFDAACFERAKELIGTLGNEMGVGALAAAPKPAEKTAAQKKPRAIRVWDEARVARIESAIAALNGLLAIISPANPYIDESWEDAYRVQFDGDLVQVPNCLQGAAYALESLNGGMAGLHGYGGNKRDVVSYLRLISPDKLFRWVRSDESLPVGYTERIERAATRYAAAHAAIPREPRAS
ncbi:hypothetical protein BKK79_36880 (plasmid) [Cupriavidus sp. USMAA2-4]|nr:hypothetical protein BKK79_36880 [Cupriavidus sp. USMAA2-4]